jgi:hypothetical protein
LALIGEARRTGDTAAIIVEEKTIIIIMQEDLHGR